MRKIDYPDIIKDAFSVVLNHRYLWWFGFFLALGGGFNFILPGNSKKIFNSQKKHWEVFLEENFFEIILTLCVIFLTFFLITTVLKTISQGGIIKLLDKIRKKEKASFADGWREGKKYFWKILTIDILAALFIVGVLFVCGIPIVYLFSIKSYFLGFFSVILVLFIVIFLIILVFFLTKYGYFYVVLSNLSVRQALESAYQIFLKNLRESVVMGIVLMFIRFMFELLLIILFFCAFTIVFSGLSVYLLALNKIVLMVATGIAAIVFFALVLFFSSFFHSFQQVAWFLFFHKIAAVKNEDFLSAEKEAIEAREKILDASEA